MSTHEHLRMSWWNAALTIAALVAAIVLAVQQSWVSSIVTTLVAVGTAVTAIYARSGRASDLTRLNAAEYVDERDRAIGARALAVVGLVAMVMTLAVFILAMVLTEPGEPLRWIAIGQVLVLAVAWMLANLVAVRRS